MINEKAGGAKFIVSRRQLVYKLGLVSHVLRTPLRMKTKLRVLEHRRVRLGGRG
jgi:hypothetical protein